MNIATTCTDRKTMARGLAEHLGCSCEYLRTPTYAFQVGRLLVERDSSISGERDDLEAAAGWLLENGFGNHQRPRCYDALHQPSIGRLHSGQPEEPDSYPVRPADSDSGDA